MGSSVSVYHKISFSIMSGVAPPANYQPQPPMSLTVGMPDPNTISRQKDAYSKMLEEQLKQGITVLDAQVKHQKDYLLAQADQQKKQFVMQIEMEVKQQEMQLRQQFEMEKQQAEMQAKMSADMQKLGVQVPMMGQMQVPQQTMMPQSFSLGQTQAAQTGQTYVYGPSGELVPK